MASFALFCFAFLALVSQQSLAKTDVIKQTCEHKLIRSKELCHSVFAAHPESKNADLTGLIHIAIDAAIKEAKIIRTKIKDLPESALVDKKIKKTVKECFDIYEKAIEGFGISKKDLESKGKHTSTFSKWARMASSAGVACEEGFAKVHADKGTAEFNKMNQKYSDISSIILALNFQMKTEKS